MLVKPFEEADVKPRPSMEVGGYGDSGAPNVHELMVQPTKLSLSKPALVKAA
jgi:hypothetical protein